MGYILKRNRSNKLVSPTVIMTIGMASPVLVTTASADSVNQNNTPQTGWDKDGVNTSNPKDASTTLDEATKDIQNQAKDKADKNTQDAPTPTEESKIGWVDVYVDHTNLDDAVKNATTNGVNVVHDATVVQTGDAEETKKNTADAEKYYQDTANHINEVTNKYVQDMNNYNATVSKNKADADKANAEMDALRSNLAAQNQTTKLESKTYSEDAVKEDTAKVQQGLADGKAYRDTKNAITNAQTHQDSLTLYTTAAAQGHIKLNRETVTITNPDDIKQYTSQLDQKYTELQSYLNGLQDQNGQIEDDKKPTYTLYTFVIDKNVETKGLAPVTTYNYLPVYVEKPSTPSVNYHILDIRSQPTTNSGYDNKDGEQIVLNPNDNAGGNVVAQAMVNQTVGIRTDMQPLPSERFDKIQDLTIITKLPSDVEFDAEASNSDPTNWTVTYDKVTNTVVQTATPQYLVQVNLNQNTNNSGTVGGTTHGEWEYKAPQVFFKLLKDDHTYQANSSVIVNKEYQFTGASVQIRTDSADPTKVNTNSKYQNIDGKAVLPGSINNYIGGWDFNQYKGVNIDSQMQQNGLSLIDDFPEDAVELTGPISIVNPEDGTVLWTADVPEGTTVGSSGTFKDKDGNDVEGFTWSIIDENSAPESLKDKIKGQALEIKYVGTDGTLYKDYVEQGRSLNVIMPMTTKKIDNTSDKEGGTYNGNTYSNVLYQSDFGNTYKSNEVTNTAPLINPEKDAVLSFSNLISMDINNNPSATIENGSYFKYRLGGTQLPTNLSEGLKSYVFIDSMDTNADDYDGQFIVQTQNKIYFKDGSTLSKRYPNGLPSNSDISKYLTQSISRDVSGTEGNTNVGTTDGADTKINQITWSFDEDFLDQIDTTKSPVHFEVFVTTKRISNAQNVRNQFKEVINGVEYNSTETFTNTRANALDELNDKLSSLEASTSQGIASNSANINSLTSALSIVVRTISDFKTSTDSAFADVQSQASSLTADNQKLYDYTNEQISLVSQQTSQAIDSVAQSANTAIQSNATKVDNVAQSTASQINSIATSTNKAISDLMQKLTKATDQQLSTITIYDSAVKSDADALQYVVNRGVAPGSIKSIKVNNQNKFVVTYNTSKTGINNSTKATISKTDINATQTDSSKAMINPTTTRKSSVIKFYTLKDKASVYQKLAQLGYSKDKIVDVSNSNGVFTATIRKD